MNMSLYDFQSRRKEKRFVTAMCKFKVIKVIK